MNNQQPNKATIKLYSNYQKMSLEEVQSCIQEGADVNYTPTSSHSQAMLHSPTLLMYSTRKTYKETELLLQNGADINTKVNNRTALDWAMEKAYLDNGARVELLLQHNPKDCRVDYALSIENTTILDMCLKKEKNPLFYMKQTISNKKFDLAKVFVNNNICSTEIIAYALKQITENPMDDNAFDFLKLCCTHNVFDESSLQKTKRVYAQLKAQLEGILIDSSEINFETAKNSFLLNQLLQQLNIIIELAQENNF